MVRQLQRRSALFQERIVSARLPLEIGCLACKGNLFEDSATEFRILVDDICNGNASSKDLVDKRWEDIWVGDHNRDKTGLNRVTVDKQLKGNWQSCRDLVLNLLYRNILAN